MTSGHLVWKIAIHPELSNPDDWRFVCVFHILCYHKPKTERFPLFRWLIIVRHWCHNEVVSLKSSVANNKNMYKQRPTRIFQFLLALVLVSNRCSQLASMENTFQEYFQSNLIMMLSSNRAAANSSLDCHFYLMLRCWWWRIELSI